MRQVMRQIPQFKSLAAVRDPTSAPEGTVQAIGLTLSVRVSCWLVRPTWNSRTSPRQSIRCCKAFGPRTDGDVTRPQKIRASGVRGLIIYCTDYHCTHRPVAELSAALLRILELIATTARAPLTIR